MTEQPTSGAEESKLIRALNSLSERIESPLHDYRDQWFGLWCDWLKIDGVAEVVWNGQSFRWCAEHEPGDFQSRVAVWLVACFGEAIAVDAVERNHRFLEEALELVQSCGCTKSEAHQLVDYVFARPEGEKFQELGGVMVTLAALCHAQSLDMAKNAETELARIWTKIEKIRAKQAAKPKHSPLAEQPAPSPDLVKICDICGGESTKGRDASPFWICVSCDTQIPHKVPSPDLEAMADLAWRVDRELAAIQGRQYSVSVCGETPQAISIILKALQQSEAAAREQAEANMALHWSKAESIRNNQLKKELTYQTARNDEFQTRAVELSRLLSMRTAEKLRSGQQLTELTEAYQERETEMESLREQLAARDATIAKLRAELAEKEGSK